MSGLRILGLTGSIATGKTHAASILDAFGIPVFDADAVVHALLAPGGEAVAPVLALFAGVGSPDGGIDRAALAARVFRDEAALGRLEAVLHPLVRRAEGRFLARCARARHELAVLDIPLLFETGGNRRVDRTLLVTCHPRIQEIRALRRCGMNRERLRAIRRRQMSEAEKRKRADFVIVTGLGRDVTERRLREIVLRMRSVPPRAWPARWKMLAALGERRHDP